MKQKVSSDSIEEKLTISNTESNNECILTEEIINKLKNYKLEDYIYDVENLGLKDTWNYICKYVIELGENDSFLNIKNFGEMYEIGLATQDKQLKKSSGQYYTPEDVAYIMSQWLDQVDGENVCDVGCGTGKLILTYLDYIGEEQARNMLENGKLYLYDFDEVALKICKTSILIKYGLDLEDKIHAYYGDFLSSDIKLPDNCKTISNPPYAAIQVVGDKWDKTAVLNDSKEYYAVFMEKIIKESKSTVIITPFSFISGSKFYSLRQVLNNYGGFICSFDNVPGNIFCGRKHGIFNTNTSNSVRAAITVVNSNNAEGFRLTPLIRFKSTERKDLLQCSVLESFLSDTRQKITKGNTMYYKCFRELQQLYDCWIEKSDKHVFKELIDTNGKYTISMPNTCRYYTTASANLMNRNGQIVLHFSEKKKFNFAFCLINSSFAYWYWRLFDGGITYPSGLLMQLPSFFDLLSDKDHAFFASITKEMINKSSEYKITKNNVGVQENIKYPRKYRDKINKRILKILDVDMNYKLLNIIHSNMALKVKSMNPLEKSPKEIMKEFYDIAPTKVIFNKSQRDELWKKATKRKNDLDFDFLKKNCPALEHQIKKSYESGRNIQSAVFSECVYSQTLANMLHLSLFVNCLENEGFIPSSVEKLLKEHNLSPRYVYSDVNKSHMLIQAGGCKGIDSALITTNDLNIYTIEFKEPGAKTSEPDLPKYKEDGLLLVNEKFLNRYPQFEEMLNEQKGLNFFEIMGNNVHNFSEESINIAVSNNYTKKYADVVCTEDVDGNLVMMPVDQISLWADVQGEIRPAGRNHYKVWTPNALNNFLKQKGATFNGEFVTISKSKLDPRKERGGNGKVSGYKINPLFFIYIKDCSNNSDGYITFDINKVEQLNPTIAGKMFFRNLKHSQVKNHYRKLY